MAGQGATELRLIRHAPADHGGRLAGRRDVPADAEALRALAAAPGALPDRLIVSPALRCRATARALWPTLATSTTDSRLWEQDFGEWEGVEFAALPDLGPLPNADLARMRPPGGESFADLCARVWPALRAIADEGDATIVAHAGTIRAALALALGDVAHGLAFDIAPLSLTILAALPGGGWSIGRVNGTLAWPA